MATRTLAELLASYPPDVQALAWDTRTLICDLLPGVEEAVDASGPYVSYGYAPGYKGVVCYMTVSRSGVKLGLAGGASLPDPRRLLEGRGKVHRHVSIASPSDLRRPGVRPLVRAAAAAWRAASNERPRLAPTPHRLAKAR
jgi:hypothetical protein